jgi:hypothetical protein
MMRIAGEFQDIGIGIRVHMAIARPARQAETRYRQYRILAGRTQFSDEPSSALARLHARVLFIDDVDAPVAAHDATVLVARLRRFQAVADLHETGLGYREMRRGE